MSGPDATAVRAYLREHGVTVHHVCQKSDDVPDVLVVFLEGYGLHETAVDLVTRMPGVRSVALSPETTAIMRVRIDP